MVADRISLTYIKNALESVEENNGKIDSILLSRTSNYGKKTVPRFNNTIEFKKFIEDLYKYTQPNDCACQTQNEGIYTLLNFSFKKGVNIISMNNLETGFQSSKINEINKITLKKLNDLNNLNENLRDLFLNYTCFPYVEFGYIDMEYVEIIKNESYSEMIDLYKKTK
tara:strand:- start:554 stop:1057 length:504 start_codon:yes stop_codon:yes gene_type:complete